MIPFLAVSESDGFALAMLVMLTLSLGSVLLILVRIARNSSKSQDDVDELMAESDEESVKPSGKKDKPKQEPWEKDADWWQK